MGTNYYWVHNKCECCGRAERTHIGKSSAGWCFALHVQQGDDPCEDNPILSLEDWKKRWKEPDSHIEDEYGYKVKPDQMLKEITERSCSSAWDPDELNDGYAMRGPNGLERMRVGEYCVGHGEGTWDLIVGEFS